ncbi:hypothetical protein P167DRAFT_579326 [Morchella conica CCBAS932]|uniref:Uncharacterized protein n=1 Tax=Morchella conica CCBAS932 TaxID=1392247 RepID=A0A3N4KA53_9PEZI|nr:hypothetical protein P167DRAFT_579326 [Morchella conica CCBAS932]
MVMNFFRQNHILPSLIAAGCTSLVQPLDISINKPIKHRIRELTDEAIIEVEEREGSAFEKWTVGQRRIVTTWTVGDAWYQFSVESMHIIINSFRNVGLSLPVDGSEEWALRIKGFEEIEIGDWRRQLEVPDQGGQFTDITEQNDYSEEIEFVAHGEE